MDIGAKLAEKRSRAALADFCAERDPIGVSQHSRIDSPDLHAVLILVIAIIYMRRFNIVPIKQHVKQV